MATLDCANIGLLPFGYATEGTARFTYAKEGDHESLILSLVGKNNRLYVIGLNEIEVNQIREVLTSGESMAWKSFEKQMPPEGAEIIVWNRKKSKKIVCTWTAAYEHILQKDFDKWLLIPSS